MLRQALFFLLFAGVQGAWADTVVGQVFYEQDYEATGVVADWTTSVSGRFTPTILEEGDNHFMAANPTQTYNNGAMLMGPNINVEANNKYVMTFDLRLRKSSADAQKPEFYITNANGNKFFSLVAKDGINNATWVLNGATDITLTGTEYANSEIVSDLSWFRFKLVWDGTNMKLTITDKGTDFSTSTSVLAETTITPLDAGKGIGNMVFTSGRTLAKFAIDNIRVTSLFSFSSDEASIDITAVGMGDRPDVSGQLPSVINEVEATGYSYSSSNWNVARVDESGHVYLVGVGTASIGVAGTNTDTYKSSYELTVYGSPATVTQYVEDDGGTGKTSATWFLTGSGLVKENYEVGVVTMTAFYGSETGISVIDATDHNVVRVIDANGYTHTNISDGSLHEDSYGGTFYRLDLAQSGTLQIYGTAGESAILLSGLSTSSTRAANSTSSYYGSSTWENLAPGTYYLYYTSLHRFTYTYTTPNIAWSTNLATVNINDVGITNPNKVTGLPTLTKGTVDTTKDGTDGAGVQWHQGYGSSNPSVAIFQGDGSVLIRGVGETIMKALVSGGDVSHDEDVAAYKLIVTGNSVTHTVTGGNTLSFDEVGVIGKGLQTANLTATGLTITYGHADETSIVTTCNDMPVLKVIDGNGYSHPNLSVAGSLIPSESAAGGTFIKLHATSDGYLIVTGNVSVTDTRIYKWGTTTTTPYLLTPEFDEENHTMSVSLGTNETGDDYYLYNINPNNGTYIPPVHSIRYVPGFFARSYETVALADISTYTVQVPKGFVDPTYEVVGTAGDVYNGKNAVGIDVSNHLTNVAGGGAIRIRATKDAKTAEYVLTVAYPATEYPGKYWNFNDGSSLHSLTAVPVPFTSDGDFTAKYKNSNNSRDARWFYNNVIDGDNAFLIGQTAGLIFQTSAGGFYMRNDDELWRHVGLFRRGASFTIPLLKAGDVVELNWKRDADVSGATFSATNLTDLRGKTVSENFVITGSRNRDSRDLGGWTSFVVAADGDVKFTLEDNGYNDLLSVRIYSGGYRSTMKSVNQYDGGNGTAAPTSILLDRAEQSVTLNYVNPLGGTATGPAMYVLKGYRSGSDNPECVTGANSQKSPESFTDEEGYPVSSDEQARLYELRRNLIGFRMRNVTWQSSNNSYNNGEISASSGYGKVTVRLNNYTNDMKYVIGYTPDYTITFGSAPHQTYPYTWNFTNISGGAVSDASTNAYNSVSSDYVTWDNLGNYRFGLYTDTNNGSFYVPGATLVAKDNSLSNDEFDGLGFTGELFFQTADGTDASDDAISTGDGNLLSYTLTNTLTSSNYQDAAIAEGDYAGYWEAGAGWVKFGSIGKRIVSAIASGGAAYTMDGGNSKNILLRPKRPFRNGDIIKFKAYYIADAASTGSNYGMRFRLVADQNASYLANAYLPAGLAKNTETEVSYTITKGDGLAGRSEIYVFRAGTTTLLTAVEITAPTENLGAGVSYGKRITASSSEPLVITIPDLNADSKQDWIYIMSSDAPTDITNATAAVAADGLDAASDVYKYKVTEAGNCDVTFAANTTISRIGVTHIMKPLTTVGEKAWATESRNRAIDYSLTGVFTLNNVDAKYATVNYDVQKATATLRNIGSYGVPASTGLVLKMKDVRKLSSANSGGVPLFAPAISTSTLLAGNIGFNGSMGNVMQPNLTERTFATEREDANGTDKVSGAFTRYILATRYMRWKKVNDAISNDETFTDGTVPVFHRMHVYSNAVGGRSASELNTLGANKAYLSLRTANLPEPLWKDQTPPAAREYIGIAGVSDMEELTEPVDVERMNDGRTYSLKGLVVDDSALRPGVYIRNGKKLIVK